jgi:hypothetical protein
MMKMNKLYVCAIAILLAGCAQVDKNGYPLSLSVDNEVYVGKVVNIEVSRDLIGPWCFEHHGTLSPDARMCVHERARTCVVAKVPGLRDDLLVSLNRLAKAECNGWRP